MAADELKSNRVRSKGTSCAQSLTAAQKASIRIHLRSLQRLTASPHREKVFFAAIDRITSNIRRRFEQPGNQQLNSLERILTDAAEGRNFAASDLNELLGAHAADFDISRLSAQLVLLPTLLRDGGPPASERILQILLGKSADMRKMMDQVVQYLQLVFSAPASTVSGERSFSALM
ncbi:hypothetical protein HPB49_009986 [Dermacentor silvarum]|uniref:Uncharacterized protein n=1 Tax=Dermacentor silvarum TaxID=543639 RepID=A0ACB8DYX1_DERSI|nr:hypothetical protein HPB49_009986 [Dermacentor silvarum]